MSQSPRQEPERPAEGRDPSDPYAESLQGQCIEVGSNIKATVPLLIQSIQDYIKNPESDIIQIQSPLTNLINCVKGKDDIATLIEYSANVHAIQLTIQRENPPPQKLEFLNQAVQTLYSATPLAQFKDPDLALTIAKCSWLISEGVKVNDNELKLAKVALTETPHERNPIELIPGIFIIFDLKDENSKLILQEYSRHRPDNSIKIIDLQTNNAVNLEVARELQPHIMNATNLNYTLNNLEDASKNYSSNNGILSQPKLKDFIVEALNRVSNFTDSSQSNLYDAKLGIVQALSSTFLSTSSPILGNQLKSEEGIQFVFDIISKLNDQALGEAKVYIQDFLKAVDQNLATLTPSKINCLLELVNKAKEFETSSPERSRNLMYVFEPSKLWENSGTYFTAHPNRVLSNAQLEQVLRYPRMKGDTLKALFGGQNGDQNIDRTIKLINQLYYVAESMATNFLSPHHDVVLLKNILPQNNNNNGKRIHYSLSTIVKTASLIESIDENKRGHESYPATKKHSLEYLGELVGNGNRSHQIGIGAYLVARGLLFGKREIRDVGWKAIRS